MPSLSFRCEYCLLLDRTPHGLDNLLLLFTLAILLSFKLRKIILYLHRLGKQRELAPTEAAPFYTRSSEIYICCTHQKVVPRLISNAGRLVFLLLTAKYLNPSASCDINNREAVYLSNSLACHPTLYDKLLDEQCLHYIYAHQTRKVAEFHVLPRYLHQLKASALLPNRIE